MKKLSMTFAPALMSALLLAACGTPYPNSPRACAGINDVTLAYNAKTGQVDAGLCGGKENEQVKLSGKTPGGFEFLYEAEGAKAFAGQMTQAELQQTLSRDRVEIVHEIISAVKSLAPASSISR